MEEQEDQGQPSLPPSADPATAALVGTVVLFAVLMLPGSLILLLLALFVISIARKWRSRRKPDVDSEFAVRFQELENGILDSSEGQFHRPGGGA